MSLQDILKKILADNQAELQQIEADLAEKKAALEVDSAEIAATEKKELEARTANALKSVEDKTASMARRENAKALQKTKRALLDKALVQFLDSLLKADDKLYTQICEKLVAALPFNKGTLHVPADREAIMKRLAPGFSIHPDSTVAGGFVATHGGSEIDNTFSNLVHSEYKDELEMYLADQLKLV